MIIANDYVVLTISSVQFSCSVVSDSLQPHELQHATPPSPSPTPGVHSDSRPSSHFSSIQLFVTIGTVAHQCPLSMGFFRQEYWSGLPCPKSGYFPTPGTKSSCLTSPTMAGGFFTTSTTRSPHHPCWWYIGRWVMSNSLWPHGL